MLIIDGDYPMASVAMQLRRDLTLPIIDVRQRGVRDGDIAMASLPEMRLAGICAALVKIVADTEREGNSINGALPSHRAYATGRGQLSYYVALEHIGEIRLLRTAGAFQAHLDEWDAANGPSPKEEADMKEGGPLSRLPVGTILGLEGADAIVAPGQIDEWWDVGVRVVSLGHYGVNSYAHGTGTGMLGGLLPPGIELLRGMDRLGMILDITHTSDLAVRQSLEIFAGPILASHSNARAIVPGERQLPDDIARSVFERDGVIGASMDTFMLNPHAEINWGTDSWPAYRSLFPREAITLDHYADHIDYYCQLAGDALHVGIGSDADWQSGREGAPLEIDTVADYQRIADVLRGRGYAEADVENVMNRNWRRMFERALPS